MMPFIAAGRASITHAFTRAPYGNADASRLCVSVSLATPSPHRFFRDAVGAVPLRVFSRVHAVLNEAASRDWR